MSSAGSSNSNADFGGVAYSDDDGETWTHASVGSDIGSGGEWANIVWGGDKFVIQGTASSNGSTYTPIRYSYDGITWHNANVPTGHGYGMAMAYGDGNYVVVPNKISYNGASAGYGLYSSDGINWSVNYMGNTYWNTVTYGDGKFVACAYSTNDNPTGANIAYSTNGGASWSYISAYNTLNWSTIGYGDGKFIALNHDWHSSHYTNDTSGIDGLKMMYSTNGTSWSVSGTSGINGFENSSIWRDIEYADGLWVAVSSNNEPNGTKQLGYSTDGLNWTLREPYGGVKTNNMHLYSVVKTANRWIAPVRGNGYNIYDGSSSGIKPLVSDNPVADWGSSTQLTLTDTTVSKISDGSLIGGTTISQALTVGETVQSDFQTNFGWIASLGTSGDEGSNDIEVDSSGNVCVVGRTASYSKGFVLRLNSSGDLQWNREMSGSNSEQYHAVATDSSGNVYAVGKTNSVGQGGYDWLVAKYAPTGFIEWRTTLGTSSPNGEEAWGIDVDDSGNVYVSGAYIISGTAQSGWAVAKFNSS